MTQSWPGFLQHRVSSHGTIQASNSWGSVAWHLQGRCFCPYSSTSHVPGARALGVHIPHFQVFPFTGEVKGERLWGLLNFSISQLILFKKKDGQTQDTPVQTTSLQSSHICILHFCKRMYIPISTRCSSAPLPAGLQHQHTAMSGLVKEKAAALWPSWAPYDFLWCFALIPTFTKNLVA